MYTKRVQQVFFIAKIICPNQVQKLKDTTSFQKLAYLFNDLAPFLFYVGNDNSSIKLLLIVFCISYDRHKVKYYLNLIHQGITVLCFDHANDMTFHHAFVDVSGACRNFRRILNPSSELTKTRRFFIGTQRSFSMLLASTQSVRIHRVICHRHDYFAHRSIFSRNINVPKKTNSSNSATTNHQEDAKLRRDRQTKLILDEEVLGTAMLYSCASLIRKWSNDWTVEGAEKAEELLERVVSSGEDFETDRRQLYSE